MKTFDFQFPSYDFDNLVQIIITIIHKEIKTLLRYHILDLHINLLNIHILLNQYRKIINPCYRVC